MSTTPIQTGNAFRPIADALRALADAIESVSTPPADEWISLRPKETIAGFGVRGRVVADAGRKGELKVWRIGGKPHVRRSELERWAQSRRVTPKARTSETAADDNAYAAIVAGSSR
jgi:hypothetical protein